MSLPSEFGVTLLFETIGTVAPSSSSPLYERDKTVAPVQRTVDRPEEAAKVQMSAQDTRGAMPNVMVRNSLVK